MFAFNADKTKVISYKIHVASGFSQYGPTSWTFEGSDNGQSWVTLDTRSGISWSSSVLIQTFDISMLPFLRGV